MAARKTHEPLFTFSFDAGQGFASWHCGNVVSVVALSFAALGAISLLSNAVAVCPTTGPRAVPMPGTAAATVTCTMRANSPRDRSAGGYAPDRRAPSMPVVPGGVDDVYAAYSGGRGASATAPGAEYGYGAARA
ncbi:hypothetical protein AMAG_18608 [Allomyces macrogynus ATCC 38327]|uniref:Uncharacterized protein n=1 Tax=Allomyces macrogynus (strain ATCC 38327) TaxID=578462 RepID=A0A0L0SEI2_ALLM3|nr:hypothetical protein AMAG_18608 [Allomyces macrogynus ATCC 38327]|eukprot:KNE60800.1 hypothetical protein AMAG_18608 [Allomyces macrogynus ATCC 38327]